MDSCPFEMNGYSFISSSKNFSERNIQYYCQKLSLTTKLIGKLSLTIKF